MSAEMLRISNIVNHNIIDERQLFYIISNINDFPYFISLFFSCFFLIFYFCFFLNSIADFLYGTN